MQKVSDIKKQFIELRQTEQFVIDKTGVKTVEIVGAQFIADEPVIFGSTNHDYVEREIQWYESMSLNVNDIPGGPPAIWKQVATPDGRINSNYGWMIYSDENYSQYQSCVNELKKNRDSRRATMLYTRPSMQIEYNKDGMSDFCCTYATQHFIRNNKLVSIVTMRSNDGIFGYKNDFYWQKYVHGNLADELQIEAGDIIWQAGSLHIYERHFELVK